MSEYFTYTTNFVKDHEKSFFQLNHDLDWEHRDAPRSEYWTSLDHRSYTYGHGKGERTYHSKSSHPVIDFCRGLIKEKIGVFLEGCFCNRYETSREWLGWHSDDDAGIDHTKPIAIVTLGNGRPIKFRKILNEKEYGEPVSIMLESGSLMLMNAGCQYTHQHSIPKVGFDIGPRISLTYRGLI